MSGIDVRSLFQLRRRITRLRARPWSERLQVTSGIGFTLFYIAMLATFRGLIVAIYTPAAITARLFNIRFPYSHAIYDNFGHLAVDIGLYAQAQTIGLRPARRAVLVVSRNKVPNKFLLNGWRSRFFVASHPMLAFLLTPFKWSKLSGTPMYLMRYKIRSEQGELLQYGPAIDEIIFRYSRIDENRPLLTIDDETCAKGHRNLQAMGIPKGAWWVALHAREADYHGVERPPRNVDPLSYLAAAQAIIDRGGYVVRIGDPGMTPLPQIDGLIDYAHSQYRTDWMDIFIISKARFLLMSNSGPGSVAWLFGVPVAGTNWVPFSQGLLGQHDVRIPKLIVNRTDSEVLSFEHVLGSESLRDIHTNAAARDNDIEWIDNTAEEICEFAVEMLNRVEGIATYDSSDHELQSRFHNLVSLNVTPQTWGSMSGVGKHFLRSHNDLIDNRGPK
jgi:putative glycosyltransferase (TIGR04372 family)